MEYGSTGSYVVNMSMDGEINPAKIAQILKKSKTRIPINVHE